MKNLLNIFKLLIVLSLPISLSAENLYENLNAEELKRLNYLSDNNEDLFKSSILSIE